MIVLFIIKIVYYSNSGYVGSAPRYSYAPAKFNSHTFGVKIVYNNRPLLILSTSPRFLFQRSCDTPFERLTMPVNTYAGLEGLRVSITAAPEPGAIVWEHLEYTGCRPRTKC